MGGVYAHVFVYALRPCGGAYLMHCAYLKLPKGLKEEYYLKEVHASLILDSCSLTGWSTLNMEMLI